MFTNNVSLCTSVSERLVSLIVSCIESEDINKRSLAYVHFLQNVVKCNGVAYRYESCC